VSCVPLARALSRRRCREVFEQRFTAARMAQDYCNLYELVGERRCQLRA
jgi:hypothetical protein